jgi:hypothetical protein
VLLNEILEQCRRFSGDVKVAPSFPEFSSSIHLCCAAMAEVSR